MVQEDIFRTTLTSPLKAPHEAAASNPVAVKEAISKSSAMAKEAVSERI